MKKAFAILTLLGTLGALALAQAQAGPAEELASFSAFSSVNLQELANGKVMAERGSLMKFPRGLSVQSCFVVKAPAEKTSKVLFKWNPSSHSDLKVHAHQNGTPDSKALIRAFEKADASNLVKAASENLGEFHLNKKETLLAQRGGKDSQAAAASFWKEVLENRAGAFQKGGLSSVASYQGSQGTITPSSEFESLLSETPKLSKHFGSLLRGALLRGESAGVYKNLYWELFDVEGEPTLDLGATFLLPQGKGYQAVDCQYYLSNGYYLGVVLYQLWPVQVGGKEMTLVWRGDLISAPSIAYTRGVERMATGLVMLKEITKTVQFFKQDVVKGNNN